jgi:hypothetical protein
MSEVHWVGLVMLRIMVQELLNIEKFLSLKILKKNKMIKFFYRENGEISWYW